MQKQPMRSDERGFTLIELMIVVAIIAILAGILIPNFVNARAQAQTSACESNLRAIGTAMELMYADQQNYGAGGDVIPATFLGANGVQYMNNTPTDPAATAQNAHYTVAVTAAKAGAPATYTVSCPGTHVASTLVKLVKAADGTQCGTGCGATQLLYVAGTGIQVQ